MGQLRAELDFTSVTNVIQNGLHEYLDGLQKTMNEIDMCLRSDFSVSGFDSDGTVAATQGQTQSQTQSQTSA